MKLLVLGLLMVMSACSVTVEEVPKIGDCYITCDSTSRCGILEIVGISSTSYYYKTGKGMFTAYKSGIDDMIKKEELVKAACQY